MSPQRPTADDVRFVATPTALRSWFDANHATEGELWLGYYKVSSGRAGLTWSQAVDEALCVGWIDSVRYSLDATAHAQRFTPRRPGSIWSAVNVAKVAALTAEGRMRPAGLAAFAARKPERTAVYAYEQAPAVLADGDLVRLRAVPQAWHDWQARTPTYRRTVTHWITSAKQAATRERRLTALIEDSAAGRAVKPFARPGER